MSLENVNLNKIEYLLTCLIEECSEVQKEACKAIRFGLTDFNPNIPGAKNNAENLVQEYVDLSAVFGMLTDEEVLPMTDFELMYDRKTAKMEKYMEYAKTRGTLNV